MVITLTIGIKKNWRALCQEFQNTHDNQQSQTQAKVLLESTTRPSGEQIKAPALLIEQIVGKAYVNNAPDMESAHMNDALVKAIDPQ